MAESAHPTIPDKNKGAFEIHRDQEQERYRILYEQERAAFEQTKAKLWKARREIEMLQREAGALEVEDASVLKQLSLPHVRHEEHA